MHDLPGVGSNLQDHFNTYCTWRISRSISLNELHHSIPRQLVAGAQYVLCRGGPMSGNGLYVGALVRSDPALERPGSADEHLRLEHDRSHARRHHLASVPGLSRSARCICVRKAAARCA